MCCHIGKYFHKHEHYNQYERTGLVLSNGDRVVTYNSSTKPYTIQVMGYEGS